MGKRTASTRKGASRKTTAKELEPLSKLPLDGTSITDWLGRLDALPLKEKNRAIRENAEALDHLFGDRLRNGDSLLRPLAAEHEGSRDEGEYTFLVSLRPMRERLIAEYGLKSAAEFMLLDAVVLSYYQYLRAATSLHRYTAYGQSYNYETLVRYAQVYLTRANEMFLRNLDALRQLKAAPFTIKIEQAGQVNVGEKQVNLAAKGFECPEPATGNARPPSESHGRHAEEAVRVTPTVNRQLGPPPTESDRD